MEEMDISYEMFRCDTNFSPDNYSCFFSFWQFDVRVQRCKVNLLTDGCANFLRRERV